MPVRPLAGDGTTTEVLDACSMSKGIEEVDDRWRQGVALAGRSEEDGWKRRHPRSESVGGTLKRVVARLEEGDEELGEGRPLVT